ncbi:MAG: discoidin domain-containing protein, partial [Nonomuraea sp.]|nr:discoidin domain-containing protein [Nonomuraea sp.]
MRRHLVTAALVATVSTAALTTVLTPAPAARAADGPANLAPAGAATASSVELDRADFAAAHVNDGDTETRWSSKYADDSWVQVHLAEPAKVDHVT